jgi:hypothetical protein
MPDRSGASALEKRWPIVRTTQFSRWSEGLSPELRRQVEAGLRQIEKRGPLLGRPSVDSIKGSRFHHLKELRFNHGLLVLFAFDPRHQPILLAGGDKTGQWNRWYRRQVPAAEGLYVEHLRSIGKEGTCLSPAKTRGRATGRSR